jgi:hypothetical protein
VIWHAIYFCLGAVIGATAMALLMLYAMGELTRETTE